MGDFNIIELATIVGLIFTIATILARLGEHYIVYHLNKNKNQIVADEDIEFKQRIKELYVMACRSFEILQKTDESGTPLVYFPKAVNEVHKEQIVMQQKVVERLAEITFGQQRLAELLDRIEARIDKDKFSRRHRLDTKP